MTMRFGGSFAPPLTEELLASYKSQIDSLETSPLKDALTKVHECCTAWWDVPESTGGGRPHPSGAGTIVDLDDDLKQKLFDAIPWKEELAMYQSLFDGIDPVGQRDLRNAAFHLLWHAKELELDREPITNDKL